MFSLRLPIGFVMMMAAVTLSGCGDSGPQLIRATGTATYKGQPLVGALVTFVFPGGEVASGNTDAAGKFAIDAPAGDAKVAITKVSSTSEEPMDTTKDPKEIMAKRYGNAKSMEAILAKTKDELPKRYSNPDSSGLVASVKVGGTNDFSFALVD